jgi:hypothetical protein
MSVQVTLTITDDQYRRAERIARSRRRDVAEVLAEAITLPETVAPARDDGPDTDTAVAREEAAFYRLHPHLWQNYRGEHVAIYNEEMVDHDPDQVALYLRVKARYPDQFVWIAPVRAQAEEEYVMRSPRLAAQG